MNNLATQKRRKGQTFPSVTPYIRGKKIKSNYFLMPHGRVPEPGTHKKNALTTKNTKDKPEKAPQSPGKQHNKSTTATPGSGQLPNTSPALGALVGLCAVVPSSASDSAGWIEISDAEALGKICIDQNTCARKYRLINNITGGRLPHAIGNETNPFTGELDGNCRTIDNLHHCLVKNLKGGHIRDLHFSKANITSTETAGVAVCEMSRGATISNILVTHSNVMTSGDSAGIAVGSVDEGKVINTLAVGCNLNLTTSVEPGKLREAGIGAGYSYNSTVTHTTAKNCMVETSDGAGRAGIGVGSSHKSIVTGTKAINCTVETKGSSSDAGIGAGYNQGGIVTDTEAVNCTVKTFGHQADAGIGAGENVASSIIFNSKPVNIAVGNVTNTKAINCTVSTFYKRAKDIIASKANAGNAGIGAGLNEGNVANTTAFNCTVTTDGIIGGKKGVTNAGIGAGKNTGMVTNTTAVNCNVQTSDQQSHAGIGAGKNNNGNIARTTVINSNVTSPGKASITGGVDPDICNVRVNDILQVNTDQMKCSELLNADFCKNVDPRLAKPNCQAPDTLYGTDASLTCPVTLTTPTPVASSGTATIAGIAVGALFFVAAVGVIGVYAYRLYQRSATNDGGNRPMPGHLGSEPGPERPEHHYDLPVSPELHQELLSVRQENNATPPPRGAYYTLGQQHPDCPIYESLSSGYLHIFDEDKTPVMIDGAGMTPKGSDSTVAVINIS